MIILQPVIQLSIQAMYTKTVGGTVDSHGLKESLHRGFTNFKGRNGGTGEHLLTDHNQ